MVFLSAIVNMDLNFPLVIICLLLPVDVYTKPTPRDKDSVVADLRRLIDLLKREKTPYDDNDEPTDTDPYDDNDEQTDTDPYDDNDEPTNTDPYEDIHDFDHYEEYVLPDDMHWGGDEWMELEEDGLGHGYDIIDNMTLGLDEIPLDLFASFEVFDGDEYDRPFIDFQNLPVQIAQNKDHHRSKYPKLDRRNFDQEVNLWDWTIPYDIDRSRITEQKHVECIERGIKDINELTCLNMVKKEKMDSPTSILRFTDDGGGCWSYVGYTGWSVQDIGLSRGCFLKATVIHEIMHAIGMQHEHQRADRDKYIEMLWDNIRQGKQNENMKLEKTKDTNPYDIESLLQYGLFSFKKTRGYTMRARDKNLEFLPDTANGLTFYDVMDITSGYQCTKNCKTKPNCIHGGFVGHRCKCMCPSGTKGATCQHIDSDCGKIIHLKSGESEVITSPNYPNTYGVDKECVWLVKNVDGTKIHLDFEDLHLPKNPGNNRCHHWLEVRYNLIGQTGPKRCGSITSTASAASLVSNGNLMMLKLNSRFAKDKAPAKGFKVKVTAEGQGQNKPCDKSPCKNGGSCVNEQNSYTCTCAQEWKGKTCTVSVNPCNDSPCKNGGTCSRNGDAFTCKCATGWTGKTCTDHPVNPCECAPCKNDGSCTKDGNSFTCTCTTGWTGKCCTDPVNPCESAPCRNGGSCTKDSNSFTCACTTGWTGITCSDPVSPCESAPCMNGGTCTKDGYSFTCACTTGWTGKNCAEQQSHPCYNFPCKENEICEVNGDSYACTPDQDLEENNGADHNEQPCDSSPCKNNELCENVGDTFICRCVEWYEGTPCTEQPHLPCDNFPCKDNEICEVIGDSYTCTPDQGLGDNNSDNEVLPCDDIAQCHHELCESKSDSFMCQCTTNTGTICSKTPMELQCTFETQKCFLFDDYTVKQASERSFISAAASGSKFVMADHSEPIVVLRINKNTTKLTSGQQYCLSFEYIIGGKPDSAFIEVGSEYHKSATPGWTSANYQFTNDYPTIMMFVYDEDSYGAIDDVTLSSGPCGNWNTL